MNIQELLDWRHSCFICGSELEIFPEITGAMGTFSIRDNWMQVESKFIKFKVHVLSGEIQEPEGQETTIDHFIGGQSLRIKAHCVDCFHNGKYYEYSGKVTLIPPTQRTSCISKLEEQLGIGNNWSLNQYWDQGYAHLFLSNPAKPGIVTRCNIDLPAIDLKKTTLQQLENKIKIYVVFS